MVVPSMKEYRHKNAAKTCFSAAMSPRRLRPMFVRRGSQMTPMCIAHLRYLRHLRTHRRE